VPVNAAWTETVSTTTHITSTATASSTTTTTLTTTSTVFGALETFYAACDTNNLVSTVNGNAITNAQSINGFAFAQGPADAYDCCVACLQSDTCGAALFYDTFLGDPQKQCYMVRNGGVCSASSSVASLVVGGVVERRSLRRTGTAGSSLTPERAGNRGRERWCGGEGKGGCGADGRSEAWK
jgi:hypothetical protein